MMTIDDISPELEREIICRYWRRIAAKGGRSGSKIARRLATLRHIKRTWMLRRLRYGPTGRRPVDVRLRSRLEGNPAGIWQRKTE